MQITNVKIYGLEESEVASGYPFRTDLPSKSIALNPNDEKRANKLATLGDGHDCFLQGIIVQFDLTCTIKMWTQIQRYHFVEFVSSQSTMHKIAQMNLIDQYGEHVDMRIVAIMRKLQLEYQKNPTEENFLRLLYSSPVGLQLTARLSTNFRQLKTIYNQRKNHRLKEWKDFCNWILLLSPICYKWLGESNE